MPQPGLTATCQKLGMLQGIRNISKIRFTTKPKHGRATAYGEPPDPLGLPHESVDDGWMDGQTGDWRIDSFSGLFPFFVPFFSRRQLHIASWYGHKGNHFRILREAYCES